MKRKIFEITLVRLIDESDIQKYSKNINDNSNKLFVFRIHNLSEYK